MKVSNRKKEQRRKKAVKKTYSGRCQGCGMLGVNHFVPAFIVGTENGIFTCEK